MNGNRRHFGHVSDEAQRSAMAPAPVDVPNFDEAQVRYLKTVFPGIVPTGANSQDDLVALNTIVAINEGASRVIAHIESLIAQRKAQS